MYLTVKHKFVISLGVNNYQVRREIGVRHELGCTERAREFQ